MLSRFLLSGKDSCFCRISIVLGGNLLTLIYVKAGPFRRGFQSIASISYDTLQFQCIYTPVSISMYWKGDWLGYCLSRSPRSLTCPSEQRTVPLGRRLCGLSDISFLVSLPYPQKVMFRSFFRSAVTMTSASSLDMPHALCANTMPLYDAKGNYSLRNRFFFMSPCFLCSDFNIREGVVLNFLYICQILSS